MTVWAVARYDLHLEEDDFWRLTPAQFDALHRRHLAAEEREDLRAGIVASTIANANRDPKRRKQPFKPQDFMPVYEKQKTSIPKWMHLLQKVEVMNAAFGGDDLRHLKQPTS